MRAGMDLSSGPRAGHARPLQDACPPVRLWLYTDAHEWRDIQRLWRTLQRAAAGFSLRRASTAS